jgi:hypothetical protein
MKKLPTGCTCMDWEASQDFHENIALLWNQPVPHIFPCRTACTVLQGVANVLPTSMCADLDDDVEPAYPVYLRVGSRTVTNRQTWKP